MSEVFNLQQLADYLSMTKAAVYHLVANGKIPGTKVGKQWRFSKSAIDKYLLNSQSRKADALVIEDDPVVRELIAQALRGAGHHTAEADSVISAVRLMEDVEFDIVFLDMVLEDGTGMDVVREMEKMNIRTEVVIVTGFPEHQDIEHVRDRLPFVTVLRKPVRLTTILDLASRAAKASAGHGK